MNTTTQASRFIPITNPDLRFMGRIDRTPADHQTWAFPYTQVSFRCTGTSIGVRLVNHWGYGDAYSAPSSTACRSRRACHRRRA